MTKDHVLELVAAAADTAEAGAARRCLEAALFHSGHIHVFVDGVDEVVPAHKEKALRFLHLFLLDAHPSARLWVTSRPEVQASLCGLLRCTPVSLLPLSHVQQLKFLTQQWASKLNAPTASLKHLAEEMVEAVAHIRSTPSVGLSQLVGASKAVEQMTKSFVKVALQNIPERDPPANNEHSSQEEETQERNQNMAWNEEKEFPYNVMWPEMLTLLLNTVLRSFGRNMFLDGWKINDLIYLSEYLGGFDSYCCTLLQTPFHLNLVAEGFFDDVRNALDTGSNLLKERLNQLEIFDRFIKVKRDYFQENHGSTNMNPSTWYKDMEDDAFKRIHQTYALKIFSSFFPEAQIPGLENKIGKLKGYLSKEKNGILWETEDGEPQFVHFSFIEFFVSTWLHDNLTGKHSERVRGIVGALWRKETCRAVLLFLDLRLAEGRRAHQAVLAGDDAALQEALAQGECAGALDAAGRSPLHLAAGYGVSGAVDQLLAAGTRSNLEARDALLEWTPLQYADAALRLEVMEMLLVAGADRSQIFNLHEDQSALPTATALDLPEVIHCYLVGTDAPTPNAILSENSSEQSQENIQPKSSHILGMAITLGSINVMKKLFQVHPTIDVNTDLGGGKTPLYEATIINHVDAVRILIFHGADPTIKTLENDTPVHAAVRGGNIHVIKMLVNSDNIDICDKDGVTPLHIASSDGSVKVVKYLLQKETILEDQINEYESTEKAYQDRKTYIGPPNLDRDYMNSDTEKSTQLVESVPRDYEQVIDSKNYEANIHSRASDVDQTIHRKALSKHTFFPENISHSNAHSKPIMDNSFPALHCASEDHNEVTKHVLSRVANIHARTRDGSQAIHIAALEGHINILEILLDSGADIESFKDNFVTPLHCASARGHEEVVCYFLTRGANVHVKSIDKLQAIHFAAAGGHSRIVDILLHAGADIESRMVTYMTPLHCAIFKGKENTTEHLLSRGANVHSRASNEQQAIHLAAIHGHTHIVEILLNAGADMESGMANNLTPLHCASNNGHETVTVHLLSLGANVHARASNGQQAIHLAAVEGHTSIVDILLEGGADIESVMEKNLTPLYCASDEGHEETTEHLILRGANVHARVSNGQQAIHSAAFKGHTGIVDILLEGGADIESVMDNNLTPLYCASDEGHEETTEHLIWRGANVHARSSDGQQAIHSAALKGHAGIVDILLEGGADIESVMDGNMTPLHCSSGKGHAEITKHLLSRGANIQARGSCGQQAIHLASLFGHTRTVDILLEGGANIESVMNNNMTPLHCAANGGHDETIKFLLSQGANVNAKSDGYLVIHRAALSGHTRIIDILLDGGADIESVTDETMTPLHCASGMGHEEMTKLFLARGANIHASVRNGEQAIHVAALRGHAPIVEILLDAGASIESAQQHNMTALHCASAFGHEEVAQHLLARGANIHARTSDGEQPLHIAAIPGHTRIVDTLLDAGADIDSVTDDNRTPLHYASERGHHEFTKRLLSRGANIQTRASDGQQAIHVVASAGHTDIVDTLLNAGADIEAVNNSNMSPLCIAVCACYVKLIQPSAVIEADLLLHVGFQENVVVVPMSGDHMGVVEILLRAGASPYLPEFFHNRFGPEDALVMWAILATPLIRELLHRASLRSTQLNRS